MWEGGGGVSGQYFRWKKSPDLKQSWVAAATNSQYSPFQSGIILGKNICLYCVLFFFFSSVLYTLWSLSGNLGCLTWVRLQQPQKQHYPVLQVHAQWCCSHSHTLFLSEKICVCPSVYMYFTHISVFVFVWCVTWITWWKLWVPHAHTHTHTHRGSHINY